MGNEDGACSSSSFSSTSSSSASALCVGIHMNAERPSIRACMHASTGSRSTRPTSTHCVSGRTDAMGSDTIYACFQASRPKDKLCGPCIYTCRRRRPGRNRLVRLAAAGGVAVERGVGLVRPLAGRDQRARAQYSGQPPQRVRRVYHGQMSRSTSSGESKKRTARLGIGKSPTVRLRLVNKTTCRTATKERQAIRVLPAGTCASSLDGAVWRCRSEWFR